MFTDIVILALLFMEPKHGYEIKKDFNQIFERKAKLNNNLLYPALRRLEKKGALKREEQKQYGRTDKKVYHITSTGKDIFQELVSSFGESDAAKEDEFMVRLAFFDLLKEKEQIRIIELRLRELKRQLNRHRSINSTFSHKFNSPWVARILDFQERRLTDEITWVEELEKYLVRENTS